MKFDTDASEVPRITCLIFFPPHGADNCTSWLFVDLPFFCDLAAFWIYLSYCSFLSLLISLCGYSDVGQSKDVINGVFLIPYFVGYLTPNLISLTKDYTTSLHTLTPTRSSPPQQHGHHPRLDLP